MSYFIFQKWKCCYKMHALFFKRKFQENMCLVQGQVLHCYIIVFIAFLMSCKWFVPHLYRYIVVLKAILDVGVSHHNVLEFMQSVIRQLEIAASACPDISSAERASLCVLWSNVADALTKYLKFHMHVNQGDEKHHDLSCFYLVMLFPFYHFYSITYKQVCNQWHLLLSLCEVHHARTLTYLLTHSMEQSPSWEANWFCS